MSFRVEKLSLIGLLNFILYLVCQVYEMFVAGYQFQVLSPIFTVHWGLQNKKSRPAWRERQNNVNRKYFEVFKREVFARYHKDPLRMLLPKKSAKKRGAGGGSAGAEANR